jgi:hypothetical protein
MNTCPTERGAAVKLPPTWGGGVAGLAVESAETLRRALIGVEVGRHHADGELDVALPHRASQLGRAPGGVLGHRLDRRTRIHFRSVADPPRVLVRDRLGFGSVGVGGLSGQPSLSLGSALSELGLGRGGLLNLLGFLACLLLGLPALGRSGPLDLLGFLACLLLGLPGLGRGGLLDLLGFLACLLLGLPGLGRGGLLGLARICLGSALYGGGILLTCGGLLRVGSHRGLSLEVLLGTASYISRCVANG